MELRDKRRMIWGQGDDRIRWKLSVRVLPPPVTSTAASEVPTATTTHMDSNRNKLLMNNAQQQLQWQVLRLAAPFAPTSATSSNSVGVGPGPAELAQLWHSVVGGTHQEQMLPRGFWRQLADSPPQSSCWTPCHLISPSIVHSLLEMSVDVHSDHHQHQQQQQHFAMDNHHNILLKPIEYSECAGGRQGVGGEAETAAVAAWMGAETNSEMDEEAVDGVGGSSVRRAEAKGTEEAPAAEDVQLEEDEPDEGEQQLLHALSPTPPARQFVHQLLTQQQQQQQQQQLDSSSSSSSVAAAEMFIYRRSSRLASPSKGPPPPISAERPCGTATITTEKTTTTAPVPDKMPKLERQEMEEQQNKRPPHSPDSGGEECENVHPPLLVAEGGADCTAPPPPPERPVPLLVPKRLLEMAATAITAHSQNEKQRQQNDGDTLRAWGALPTNCSPSSRSSSGVSTADSASLDGGGGARRMTNGGIVDDAGCKPPPPAALVKEGRGRKRLAAGNGPNDGVPPLRKRRRVGPRIGPRRKRRAQPAKGQGIGRQTEAAAQVLLEHGGVSPSSLKMALIRVPEQAQQLIADRSKRGAAPPPLLPLVSNWRPVGPGCVRRLLADSRDHFICYDAIRHRSVPGVAIRVGDCVQINSADNEDDLFVGRVLAINYEPEGRSLQLTLLWFYTQRQLPTAPADASGLDPRELFSSKHLDSVNVDSVDAVIHVLTFAEYCRYRAELAAAWPPNGQGVQAVARPCPCPRTASNYPRRDFLPPMGTPLDSVFFCRSVFSLTRKRIKSFGCAKPIKSLRCLRP
uniref:BAH domain-containing protein n=1 Tax=Globodera rostochiensis TaxID=31243 RepID=A0A914HHS8_GLORO